MGGPGTFARGEAKALDGAARHREEEVAVVERHPLDPARRLRELQPVSARPREQRTERSGDSSKHSTEPPRGEARVAFREMVQHPAVAAARCQGARAASIRSPAVMASAESSPMGPDPAAISRAPPCSVGSAQPRTMATPNSSRGSDLARAVISKTPRSGGRKCTFPQARGDVRLRRAMQPRPDVGQRF